LAMEKAVGRAREGKGPTLLEMDTYRYKGHSMSDPAKYRTKEEVEEYKSKDPIDMVLKTILDNKFASQADIDKIDQKIKEAVDDAVQFSEESPYPDPSEIYKDVYVQKDYPFIIE